MKKRFVYALAAAALLGIEICIALFVRDSFVRPYLGDVLVVVFIHCALRAVFPGKPKLLSLYVFLFACAVEFSQIIHLLDLIGLGHVQLLKTVVGGTFDWRDIVCYGVGYTAVAVIEYFYRHNSNDSCY